MRADYRMRSVLQDRRAEVGSEGETLVVVISLLHQQQRCVCNRLLTSIMKALLRIECYDCRGMKTAIVLWFCVLALLSPAQTLKTYESADAVFRFKYSGILIDCSPLLLKAKQIHRSWTPA
jgi:hypothetical protein